MIGTVQFTIPEGTIDAPQGSMMVVPPRATHSFANASETEGAEVYMTATPGTLGSLSSAVGTLLTRLSKRLLHRL